MTMPDFKSLAREFAKENGSLEVAIIQKALEMGYTIAIMDTTIDVSKALHELKVTRLKNNLPQ